MKSQKFTFQFILAKPLLVMKSLSLLFHSPLRLLSVCIRRWGRSTDWVDTKRDPTRAPTIKHSIKMMITVYWLSSTTILNTTDHSICYHMIETQKSLSWTDNLTNLTSTYPTVFPISHLSMYLYELFGSLRPWRKSNVSHFDSVHSAK